MVLTLMKSKQTRTRTTEEGEKSYGWRGSNIRLFIFLQKGRIIGCIKEGKIM